MKILLTILEHVIQNTRQPDYMKTFYIALMKAELEEFKGDGPMTVFAPSNKAFDKLPENYMNELLNDPDKTKLKELLQRHVVGDIALKRKNLNETETKLKTVGGVELVITNPSRTQVIIQFPGGNATCLRDGTPFIASNGIMYLVDTVLTSEEA